MNFAPLHIRTGYSFLESALTVEKAVSAIKKNDYYGGAITDKGVLFGIPEFVHLMETVKKPYIIGLEINIDENVISLFANTDEGYLNLCYISTHIQKGDFDFNSLKNNAKGIIGVISTSTLKFKAEFASKNEFPHYLNNIAKIFSSFYLGLDITNVDEFHYAQEIRKFAKDHAYNCLAFPSICYLKKEDAIALKIVEAIKEDGLLDIRECNGQQYFMKIGDYQKIYTEIELTNTVQIIDSNKVNFSSKRGELLHYPVEDSIKYLQDEVKKGLAQKGLTFDTVYIERATHELDVIIKMGYADYFLIVEDYVRYAKTHGILVGPGRGSGAGCLVSYLLNITDIDPLKYGLQFERFLNEGRKTMPDLDIDFMHTRRNEMFEYMRQKYGSNRVANIVTFQTIKAKQALRDIGRIYQYKTYFIDSLSRAITNPKCESLREAYKTLPTFKTLVDSDPTYLEIVSLASKIEGLPRQSGLHPAGVVVNNFDLEASLPIKFDSEMSSIAQYEFNYLEEQGFLKMDFLALINLTMIDDAIKLIEKYEGTKLDYYSLPYDCPETYDIIRSGKTMGLFQIDTVAMSKALKLIKPVCFDDVVATVAINRPGPMASIPQFVRTKEGKQTAHYYSKDMKEILAPTYGVLIYQEQITSIVKAMAGFSLSEADLFRRAVAKKDLSKMAGLQQDFYKKSVEHGYSKAEAVEMYSLIEKFANYGLNKSHAVVYAAIACQMAYLKAKYPLEFYVAILMNSAADTKLSEYVSEMRSLNIELKLPDINIAELNFAIKDQSIIYPLSAIRGVSNINAINIVEERTKKGEFTDFFDFVSRMYPYKINKDTITHLINAGCFDSFNVSRASLKASIGRALQYAEVNAPEGEASLLEAPLVQKPRLVEANEDPVDTLNYEYEEIGLMLSENPLKYKAEILTKLKTIPISEINDAKGEIKVAGILKNRKVINTKKGSQMAFITIFDQTGEKEIVLFSAVYQQCYNKLNRNSIIVITGNNKFSRGETSFLASNIELLEDLENE